MKGGHFVDGQQNLAVTNTSDAGDSKDVGRVVRELERLVENDRVDHLLVAVSRNSRVTILSDEELTLFEFMALIGYLQAEASLRKMSMEIMGQDDEHEQNQAEQQKRMKEKRSGSGMPEDCMNLLGVFGSLEAVKAFHEKMTRKNAAGYSSPFANFVPLPEHFDRMNRSWQRNWCQKNWGDKREPGHLWKMEGDEPKRFDRETYYFQYRFETAWDPPLPWLEKASLAMPEVELKFSYFEASNGFSGEALFRDGKCVKQEEFQRENEQHLQIGNRNFGLTVSKSGAL